MLNHSLPNIILPHLGDEWSKRAGAFTSYFQDVVGLPPGQHSQALYILPARPRDVDSYVDALRIKTANERKWVFLTGTAGDAKTPLVIAFPINTTFKLGKTSDALQKSTLALCVEIHSRLITWWLVNAWRSQQLADATWSLGDAFQIVPAAACARSLLETAASLWVETTNLDEIWRRIRSNSAMSGPEVGHWYEMTNLINSMLWASKFDKRAATYATSYGRLQRTNIMSYIDKLARATNGPVHDDYQWFCNAVHPSIGGMLAFAAPMMGHETKTHAFQWVCSEPIHFSKLPHNTRQLRSDPSEYPAQEEEREATVENALARLAIFAVDVIKITLDQALRVIDDIGLTTNAPATATFTYWRNIRRPGKNANCPCRSGKKDKYCSHNWNNQTPKITQKFGLCPNQIAKFVSIVTFLLAGSTALQNPLDQPLRAAVGRWAAKPRRIQFR